MSTSWEEVSRTTTISYVNKLGGSLQNYHHQLCQQAGRKSPELRPSAMSTSWEEVSRTTTISYVNKLGGSLQNYHHQLCQQAGRKSPELPPSAMSTSWEEVSRTPPSAMSTSWEEVSRTTTISYVNKLGGSLQNTTISYVNKLGGSPQNYSDENSVAVVPGEMLQASHLAGVLNTTANRDSRTMKDRADWVLPPQIFQKINQQDRTTTGGLVCIKTDQPVTRSCEMETRSQC